MEQYRSIIENDTLHNQTVIRNKQIGRLQLWAWKNAYIFLNYETGKKSIIPIETINKRVKVITREEFDRLYKEKNYPAGVFNEWHNGSNMQHSFIGDETQYTKRQRDYGLIHDNVIEHIHNTTNKIWTGDFCRSVAQIIASYNFYCEVMRRYGIIKLDIKSNPELEALFHKHFFTPNCLYEIKCEEMGLHNPEDLIITEEKIIDYIKKVNELPDIYRKSLTQTFKGKKELAFYIEKAKK